MINIIPDKIRSFQNVDRASRRFHCVVSEDLSDKIKLAQSTSYQSNKISVYDASRVDEVFSAANTDFVVMLNNNQTPKFNSMIAFDKNLHQTSRLIDFPLFATAPSYQEIATYVESLYVTEPEVFDAKVNHFFNHLERVREVYFTNDQYQTELVYKCAKSSHKERWLEVGGFCELGKKQIYPCGEIEVTPLPFDLGVNQLEQGRLDLGGEVVITGPNVVNAGYFPFTRMSQRHVYDTLATITNKSPIKIHIEQGEIIDISDFANGNHPAVQFLKQLLLMESRYRVVNEVGISYNDQLRLLSGNHLYNEMVDSSASKTGTLHLGLGLLINTQYHIDLFALGTEVHFG